MRRSLAAWLLVAGIAAAPTPARADAVSDSATELSTAKAYKVRLSAALALSKSTDDRAAEALTRALREDAEAAVRRVAALALKTVVTTKTAPPVRAAALEALAKAGAGDADKKVRAAAQATTKALEALLAFKAPRVFVNVYAPTDRTKQAPGPVVAELARAVKGEVTRGSKEFAIEWPQPALPTGAELARHGTRAFVVAAAVDKLAFSKAAGRAEIHCTIEIRVAPWGGSDGHERWVANQMGTATASGKISTGASNPAISAGMVDCVAAVAESLTSKEIVPFLKAQTKRRGRR